MTNPTTPTGASLRERIEAAIDAKILCTDWTANQLADAIIATVEQAGAEKPEASGEAAATYKGPHERHGFHMVALARELPVGTKLYTHPADSAAKDARIAELEADAAWQSERIKGLEDDLIAEIGKRQQLEASQVAGKAMRQMFEQIVQAVELDAETTVLKFKGNGKTIAEVSIADIFRKWDAAIAAQAGKGGGA